MCRHYIDDFSRDRGSPQTRRLTFRRCLTAAQLVAAVWLLAFFSPDPARAQASEYAVKAAYLFNFINFTEWPAAAFDGPSTPLTVCIVGKDPFGNLLEEVLGGESVQGHPVTVERLPVSGASSRCHVVFIPVSVDAPAAVLRGIGAAPVLTIGESDAFWRAGGMLRFAIDGDKVRFDANARAAQRVGLRLSARLMQVARSTTQGQP